MSDDLLAQVDALVADGVVASRSDAVRAGLAALVEQRRRRAVGLRLVEAYRNTPQSADELAGLDDATAALVLEEPW